MNNNTTSLPPFTVNTNTGLFSIFSSIIGNNTDTHNGVSEEFKNNLEEFTADEEFIKNKKQCSICLDEFKLGDKCIKLPCSEEENHVFHSGDEVCSGIKPWLERNNTCPMCRKEFPNDNPSIIHQPQESENRNIFESFILRTDIIPPPLNENTNNTTNMIPDPNNLENTISNIITNYINEIEQNNEQRDIQLAIQASLNDR